MTKIEKVMLLVTFHATVEELEEDTFLKTLGWILNGIDDGRVDWMVMLDALPQFQQGESN